MNEFCEVSMAEVNEVAGGSWAGALMDTVQGAVTGLYRGIEKGADLLRGEIYPPRPGTPVPCGSAPCPVPR